MCFLPARPRWILSMARRERPRRQPSLSWGSRAKAILRYGETGSGVRRVRAGAPLRFVVRERLVGNDRERVLDAGQSLQALGHEAADIGAFREVALHQEIVLS